MYVRELVQSLDKPIDKETKEGKAAEGWIDSPLLLAVG